MPPSIDDYGDFSDPENISGTPGDVPLEVVHMGWCWGAFAFGLYWVLANRLDATVFWRALFYGQIWLGLRGHDLAWQHRGWADVQQYEATMRAWDRWGLALSLAGLVAFTLVSVSTNWR